MTSSLVEKLLDIAKELMRKGQMLRIRSLMSWARVALSMKLSSLFSVQAPLGRKGEGKRSGDMEEHLHSLDKKETKHWNHRLWCKAVQPGVDWSCIANFTGVRDRRTCRMVKWKRLKQRAVEETNTKHFTAGTGCSSVYSTALTPSFAKTTTPRSDVTATKQVYSH